MPPFLTISSAGPGMITIGGTSTAGDGTYLQGSDVSITTVDGDLGITGSTASTNSSNVGVRIVGQVSISYDYPVMVNGRYLMSPSPIPAFDNTKMHMMPALQLFGAGREKRIYAIPPYTAVHSLDFDDHPFRATRAPQCCGLCGGGRAGAARLLFRFTCRPARADC